jgi:hypothetical protein
MHIADSAQTQNTALNAKENNFLIIFQIWWSGCANQTKIFVTGKMIMTMGSVY